MMIKDYFVKQGIKEAEIDKFIRTQFPYGDYSKTELQRTPLGVKIIIYTNKPGRIIGRGGKNINEITDMIKEKFGLENPQIDVKAIRNPNLDARIVAKQIASAIERGYNFKKIGNLSVKRVMGAGAAGVEIRIAGRLGGGGGKSMIGKFTEGYLKHCGHPAKEMVDYGFEEAVTKPGKVGIKVRIMKEFADISSERLEFEKPEEEKPEEKTMEKPKKPRKKPGKGEKRRKTGESGKNPVKAGKKTKTAKPAGKSGKSAKKKPG